MHFYRQNIPLFLEHNRVAVVIATHKMFPKLERCLQSFRLLLPEPHDLVFVDNGSNENLCDWVAERFPKITIIRLPKNSLFCGGYNEGIRVAMERGYKFVLISNADTEVVNPYFLQELLEAERRWPRGAFFGPQVLWRNSGIIQKTCLQFPNVFRRSWQWLPWHLNRKYFEKQSKEETTVDFLNGVCVLCRVAALKEIGLMDENMGGYVEDADWAWRAREKGWVTVFTPVPSVVHHETPSGYEQYSLKTFLLKRNTVLWFLKTGQKSSALSYAKLSIGLAWVRMMLEHSEEEKRKHRYFLKTLGRAYKGLLQGEKLGEWFGPPLGYWNNH